MRSRSCSYALSGDGFTAANRKEHTRPSPCAGPLLALRALGAVLRPALPAVVHTRAVEGAPHDVVAHARQVLHTAAADQHDGVLLQVVAFAADIARYLEA